MISGRFLTGMEQDVYEAIPKKYDEILSDQIKTRLLNEALEYVSVNTRQLELYNYMMDEIDVLEELLETKCATNKDY